MRAVRSFALYHFQCLSAYSRRFVQRTASSCVSAIKSKPTIAFTAFAVTGYTLYNLSSASQSSLHTWLLAEWLHIHCLRFNALQHSRKALLFRRLKSLQLPKQFPKDFLLVEIGGGAGENFDFYPFTLTQQDKESLTSTMMQPTGRIVLNEEISHEILQQSRTANLTKAGVAPSMLEESHKPTIDYLKSLPNNSVDVLISSFALCRLKDDEEIRSALTEISRVLKDGGQIYFLEYSAPNPLSASAPLAAPTSLLSSIRSTILSYFSPYQSQTHSAHLLYSFSNSVDSSSGQKLFDLALIENWTENKVDHTQIRKGITQVKAMQNNNNSIDNIHKLVGLKGVVPMVAGVLRKNENFSSGNSAFPMTKMYPWQQK